MKMQINSMFLDALRSKYQAQIMEALSNLEVYFKVPVGIGEHSDLLVEHDKWVDKLAAAKDKLAALDEHFQQAEFDSSSKEGGESNV